MRGRSASAIRVSAAPSRRSLRVALHDTVDVDRAMPPATYPPIQARQGTISPVATGLAGLVGGALVGAGLAASRKLGGPPPEDGTGAGKEA